MPDTVYYTNSAGKNLPYDSMPPDLKALVQQYLPEKEEPSRSNDIYFGFLVGFFGMLFFFILSYLWVNRQKENTNRVYSNDAAPEESLPDSPSEYYIYDGAALAISNESIMAILTKHYPYYNHLEPNLKKRFTSRLTRFMAVKKFVIYSQEPYKEMPVIASATAIQLTFGLDDYLLPWFVYIRIHPQEYFAANSLRILAGHVEGNTITLAWNQLLKGIKDENDGVNVGLHEMAHALYYQFSEVQGERTGKFAGYFDEVMEDGAEVYKLKTTKQVLFTDYAYRNLQEFWAESVEIFFEKPVEMLQCYPHIYITLKDLLQQNPVNRDNPLA